MVWDEFYYHAYFLYVSRNKKRFFVVRNLHIFSTFAIKFIQIFHLVGVFARTVAPIIWSRIQRITKPRCAENIIKSDLSLRPTDLNWWMLNPQHTHKNANAIAINYHTGTLHDRRKKKLSFMADDRAFYEFYNQIKIKISIGCSMACRMPHNNMQCLHPSVCLPFFWQTQSDNILLANLCAINSATNRTKRVMIV